MRANGRSQLLWAAGATVPCLAITLGFLGSTIVAVVLTAITAFSFAIAKVGVWRTMIVSSIVVSAIRSSPFASVLSEPLWYALQFVPVIVAGVSTLLSKSLTRRPHDTALLVALAIFAIVAASSALVSDQPVVTISQASLLAVVFIMLALSYTRRWSTRQILQGDLAAVFTALALLQIVGLAGAATADWAYDPDYGRFVGLFSNANYAGIVSAIGLMLGLYLLQTGTHMALKLLGLAGLAGALVMSGSRGAMLSVAVALVVQLAVFQSRRIIVSLLCALAAIVPLLFLLNPALAPAVGKFFLRDASTDVSSGRFTIYENLFEYFAHSPQLGIGYRTIEIRTQGLAAHNVYLSVLVELGLVGAGAFLFLIACLLSAARSRTNPLLGAAVVIAVVEFTESSIFGFGGQTALASWITLLAFAANGRFAAPARPAGIRPNATPATRTYASDYNRDEILA